MLHCVVYLKIYVLNKKERKKRNEMKIKEKKRRERKDKNKERKEWI